MLTRYTVMGWSCLKVRFLAGLELYRHLDSTKRSRASRAWSSDTAGTLQEHTGFGSTSLVGPCSLAAAASPDGGHQGAPVHLRLGAVGGGRRVRRVLALCRHRATRDERVSDGTAGASASPPPWCPWYPWTLSSQPGGGAEGPSSGMVGSNAPEREEAFYCEGLLPLP